MKEQAIIVVSFGTSYHESRKAISAVEQAVSLAFPAFSMYRAFTSQKIIRKLKERDGLEIDSMEEALERAAADGVKRLVVQPTHVMDGFEYMDVKAALEAYKGRFEAIVLAKPLLAEDEDCRAVAQAIAEDACGYDDGKTAICFMGHGTEAEANSVYSRLQEELRKMKGESCPYFIGTVEAEPRLETLVEMVKASGDYRRVVLQPLMLVAGDHAKKDMAGEEEESWKRVLEMEGYEVKCILKGLGELPAVRDIYTAHTREAVKRLG